MLTPCELSGMTQRISFLTRDNKILEKENRRLQDLLEEARRPRNISREISPPTQGEVAMAEMILAVSHLVAAVGTDDALHELALWLVSVAGSQDRQQTRRFVFDVAGMAVTIKPLTLTDESNVSEAVVETAANLIGRDL